MLSAWKNTSWSTMRDEDLTPRVQSMYDITQATVWAEEAMFVSVDYDKATDQVNKDASLAALAALDFHPSYDLARASFEPGMAVYPELDGERHFPVLCQGQLMGHVLSFPLLCVLNVAAFEYACEVYCVDCDDRVDRLRRKDICSVMKQTLIVNGDDFLYRGPREFIRYFSDASRQLGLHPSVGKNYVSRDFAMINSQTFLLGKDGTVHRKGYLNLRLVYGSGVKSGESMATPTQISKSLNQMFELCPWSSACLSTALGRWESKWYGDMVGYTPNWGIPVHLGGLGIDPRFLGPFTVSRQQRRMAARFVADPRLNLYRKVAEKGGASLKTTMLLNDVVKWEMRPGPRPIEVLDQGESRVEAGDDERWLERICLMGRAAYGSHPVSERIVQSKFRPNYRLNPMSLDSMLKYAVVHWVATHGPTCPALNFVPVSRSRTDFVGGAYPRSLRPMICDERATFSVTGLKPLCVAKPRSGWKRPGTRGMCGADGPARTDN
jgi:hypothetical protein